MYSYHVHVICGSCRMILVIQTHSPFCRWTHRPGESRGSGFQPSESQLASFNRRGARSSSNQAPLFTVQLQEGSEEEEQLDDQTLLRTRPTPRSCWSARCQQYDDFHSLLGTPCGVLSMQRQLPTLLMPGALFKGHLSFALTVTLIELLFTVGSPIAMKSLSNFSFFFCAKHVRWIRTWGQHLLF